MATITEDYVSFETARLLKDKGFDWCTYAYYEDEDNPNISLHASKAINWNKTEFISKPTPQMVMKWLREVHNLSIEIYVLKNFDKKICKYTYTIMDLNFPGSDDGIECCIDYETYEQACEAALKYCLKHLIW